MPWVKVKSLKNQTVIADKCVVAERFFSRLIGLVGRSHFEAGEGLFIPRCNSIHMMMMRIPIDVVFLKKENNDSDLEVFRVDSIHRNVRPWKLHLANWKASDTLELPCGQIDRHQIQVGDEVCLSSR